MLYKDTLTMRIIWCIFWLGGLNMVRLNITMPDDLAKELEKVKNKSSLIAQALREKFQREKRTKLEQSLIEGYQSLAKEDKIVNQEWERITLEIEEKL